MYLSSSELARLQVFVNDGIKMVGLRKVRARLIAEALIRGEVFRGNTHITVHESQCHETNKTIHRIVFEYRGTLICAYFTKVKTYMELDAGIYETTASTASQRHQAKMAIEEVFGGIDCVQVSYHDACDLLSNVRLA